MNAPMGWGAVLCFLGVVLACVLLLWLVVMAL